MERALRGVHWNAYFLGAMFLSNFKLLSRFYESSSVVLNSEENLEDRGSEQTLHRDLFFVMFLTLFS